MSLKDSLNGFGGGQGKALGPFFFEDSLLVDSVVRSGRIIYTSLSSLLFLLLHTLYITHSTYTSALLSFPFLSTFLVTPIFFGMVALVSGCWAFLITCKAAFWVRARWNCLYLRFLPFP